MKSCIDICIILVNAILVVQRRSHRWFSVENVFLQISQNSQENTCGRAFSLGDSITGFSGEISKICKTTLFTKHLWATAFVFRTTSNIYVELFCRNTEAVAQRCSLKRCS